MSKMRVMQVTRPGGPFELAERDIPEPGIGQVRSDARAHNSRTEDSDLLDSFLHE